jgi:hypothetical protein
MVMKSGWFAAPWVLVLCERVTDDHPQVESLAIQRQEHKRSL